MVSGMLAMILDFARDSFSSMDEKDEETPERFKIGDLTIWLEYGPLAFLAVVVRGTAPEDFKLHLGNSLRSIHENYAAALASFDGDAKCFENARTIFESCLGSFVR